MNFAPVSENRDQIITNAKALKAQGYTPITYVLGLAAKDFTEKERDPDPGKDDEGEVVY